MSNKKHNINLPKEDSLYIQELKFMQYIMKRRGPKMLQSIKAKKTLKEKNIQ